jgi:hypothetical protein
MFIWDWFVSVAQKLHALWLSIFIVEVILNSPGKSGSTNNKKNGYAEFNDSSHEAVDYASLPQPEQNAVVMVDEGAHSPAAVQTTEESKPVDVGKSMNLKLVSDMTISPMFAGFQEAEKENDMYTANSSRASDDSRNVSVVDHYSKLGSAFVVRSANGASLLATKTRPNALSKAPSQRESPKAVNSDSPSLTDSSMV